MGWYMFCVELLSDSQNIWHDSHDNIKALFDAATFSLEEKTKMHLMPAEIIQSVSNMSDIFEIFFLVENFIM